MNESILTKLRIPTLLGLAIIILGTAAGVYGVLRYETTNSKVSAQETPQNIIITNITSEGATVSWQTPVPTLGYITFGKNSTTEQTALDDRDNRSARERKLHYVNLQGLNPETTYQFKIVSGRFVSEESLSLTTPEISSSQNGFKPIIGNVVLKDEPQLNGIVYLYSDGMADQSSLLGSFGSFIIPISLARKEDLSGIFQPTTGTSGKLKVISEDGGIASATFNITLDSEPLGTLRIGADISFTTTQEPSPPPSPRPNGSPRGRFDLNGDGILNASDYSIMLSNLGRNPKDKRTDLNSDGVVDQKDLKIMQDEIDRFVNQS